MGELITLLGKNSQLGMSLTNQSEFHIDGISSIDFNHSDVVRHPLVSKIVKAYSDNND